MSLRNSYKSFYSEGIAAEHPDVAGQKEFAKKADAEVARRKAARAKKAGPQLPSFVASVRKEETELDERTLTPAETAKKEKIVKSMKKGLSGFKQRYGERAKEVMYATATARAKGE